MSTPTNMGKRALSGETLVTGQLKPSFTQADVEKLRASLFRSAKVVLEGEPGYEEGISRWSKTAEKRASIVVFPTRPKDVSEAILFSIRHNLKLAVCGGGHSCSGASSTQGGLCINLSGIRRVSVDKETKTVTVEGGALWKDVDIAAGKVGLAVPGGTVNHTGVAGLTLGGGFSYLTPSLGLTIDSLLSVEFVLADGSIVIASHTENTDLFWAARGAGNAFGVATKFTFRGHEQKNNIWAAQIVLDKTWAFQHVMKFTNNFMAHNDKKAWMFMGSTWVDPEHERPAIMCICFYNGTYEEAMKVYGPLAKMEHQLYSHFHQMPYYEMNGLMNNACKHGYRRTMKGCSFIPYESTSYDIAWDNFEAFEKFTKIYTDTKKSIVFLEFIPSDKICQVDQTATAYANRGALCNLLYIMCWDDPTMDLTVRNFVREQVAAARTHYDVDRARLKQEDHLDASTASSVGEYNNHDSNGAESDGRAVFGPNFDRLVALKLKFDPTNIFCKGPRLLDLPPEHKTNAGVA